MEGQWREVQIIPLVSSIEIHSVLTRWSLAALHNILVMYMKMWKR